MRVYVQKILADVGHRRYQVHDGLSLCRNCVNTQTYTTSTGNDFLSAVITSFGNLRFFELFGQMKGKSGKHCVDGNALPFKMNVTK